MNADRQGIDAAQVVGIGVERLARHFDAIPALGEDFLPQHAQLHFSEAVAEGFEHALGDRQAAMQPRIDEFLNTFKQEAINEGDVFEMLYQPGTGTLISKNGKQINTIKGLDFKSALFAIWLGKEPAQDSLKQGMLGQ